MGNGAIPPLQSRRRAFESTRPDRRFSWPKETAPANGAGTEVWKCRQGGIRHDFRCGFAIPARPLNSGLVIGSGPGAASGLFRDQHRTRERVSSEPQCQLDDRSQKRCPNDGRDDKNRHERQKRAGLCDPSPMGAGKDPGVPRREQRPAKKGLRRVNPNKLHSKKLVPPAPGPTGALTAAILAQIANEWKAQPTTRPSHRMLVCFDTGFSRQMNYRTDST
jgi:hypothetical protein